VRGDGCGHTSVIYFRVGDCGQCTADDTLWNGMYPGIKTSPTILGNTSSL
jgi:hypothetical protein